MFFDLFFKKKGFIDNIKNSITEINPPKIIGFWFLNKESQS
jgi:hypothetical protein